MEEEGEAGGCSDCSTLSQRSTGSAPSPDGDPVGPEEVAKMSAQKTTQVIKGTFVFVLFLSTSPLLVVFLLLSSSSS